MLDMRIDLGQVLLLAGGAAAWIGSIYANKVRVDAIAERQANFEARVEKKLDDHGAVLFSMSGQLQRVIGTLTGGPPRRTDPLG